MLAHGNATLTGGRPMAHKRDILRNLRDLSKSLDHEASHLLNDPTQREQLAKKIFDATAEMVAKEPAMAGADDSASDSTLGYDKDKGSIVLASRGSVASSAGTYDPDWSLFENRSFKDLYPHANESEITEEFLYEVSKLMTDYVKKQNDRSVKVLDFHRPHQLREIMDHCLDLSQEPRPLEQILSDCKETLKYCVRTGHPRFFNQLSSGLDVVALAGEWLTATANTNMFTYEVAPVFTLMEQLCLDRMRQLIGWQEGDGIFAPGGAIANLYAVLAARHRIASEIKTEGLFGRQPLLLFVSQHAHFSFKKAAAILGIGADNVIPIAVDKRGKMKPCDLQDKIVTGQRRGALPFFVCATGGTTVLGAYDPVAEVARIAQQYHLWLHVDTAWGGGVLFSRKHRYLLNGIEQADSVTWNPHKMMGMTLQCSAFLTRHLEVLHDANSMCANYLFQQDKNYDVSYDTGDKSIQCGRHNDVFKLWLSWRARGDNGFETHINRLFDLAAYLRAAVRHRPGFEVVMPEANECTNVSFWYIPTALRNLPPDSAERLEQLNKVAPKIKALMMEKGSTMVGYQPLGSLPNFFRVVISNAAATEDDLMFLLREIEQLGEEI